MYELEVLRYLFLVSRKWVSTRHRRNRGVETQCSAVETHFGSVETLFEGCVPFGGGEQGSLGAFVFDCQR